jgi:hypothetical protein
VAAGRGAWLGAGAGFAGYVPSEASLLPSLLPYFAPLLEPYNTLSAAIRRQVFTFADSDRCSYSVDEVFFPLRFTVFVTTHTLIHLHPGPSVVTGFMGSLRS